MRTLILLFFLVSTSSFSKEINIRDSIELRNLYLELYPALFGAPQFSLEKDFKILFHEQKEEDKKKIKTFLKELDSKLPSKFLRPLIYWRYIQKDASKQKDVLLFIQLHKLMSLRDYIINPQSQNPLKALQLMRELTQDSDVTAENFYAHVFEDLKEKSTILAALDEEKIFIQSMLETKLIVSNPSKKLSDMNSYVLDPYGLIAGNQVQLLSFNTTDKERIEWVNENSIFNGGKLDFSLPFMTVDTHPAFTQDEIFIRMKEMIKRAKKSVLIDIFLFGGTMGGTFAKFAINQALKKEKGFKILFLHDYATNYNMKDEMMPIFEYIKKRIDADPAVKERVFLLQANIQRHPPGVPFNLTGLIPKTDQLFKEIEKRNTYFESKIDHSKVLIIDANTDAPEAYFGSKNWTDHSGSYYFDNTLWVKGPAAALIQDSYLEDIEASLTEDEQEMSWFFYKESGFDNKNYLSRKQTILEFFKIKRDSYPAIGETTLRIAEANVDGRIRNVRNSLIELIKNSKENIYMEQLFLYDPYVTEALILKKKTTPSVKIQILVDHNGNFGFNGFPNTIFVKKMIEAGIEIRTRKTIGVTATFRNGITQEYHQENHRKISSFDGKILLVGSSNINPDTLQGSFRELGAVVYNSGETAKFNSDFKAAWNNKEETSILNIEDYQMKIGENYLSKVWSAIINDFGATLLRSKDSIERRY